MAPVGLPSPRLLATMNTIKTALTNNTVVRQNMPGATFAVVASHYVPFCLLVSCLMCSKGNGGQDSKHVFVALLALVLSTSAPVVCLATMQAAF